MSDQTTLSMGDYLSRRRIQLLAELTVREAELTRELVSVLDAQDKLRADQAMVGHEYAGYRQAIDAVRAHLEKFSRPMTEDELVEAILAGGFGPHDRKRKYNVRDSIVYHSEKGTRLVRNPDGTLSLPEWTS